MKANMSNKTMQTKAGKPIKFSDLEPSKISFEPVLETETKSPQKYGFMRYDGKKFATQTPELVLRVGGIPQFNATYHKKTEVEDRGYAKLPLDEAHLGGKSMMEKLKEIDEYFEAHQDVVFGDNSKYYQYVPLLRYPNVDEEEQQPKEVKNSKYPPLPKLPYIRAKLDFDNTTKLLKTQLILREETGDLTTPVVEHVDDIRQHFRLNCEYRAILTFSKYWVAKTKKSSGKDAKKEWGVSLKITKLQVKSRPMNKGEKEEFDFDDSDEQPSEVKQVVKKQVKSEPVVEQVEAAESFEAEQEEQAEEVVEEQQEQDEEEDLEPVSKKQPKKVVESAKPKGKATAKATGKKTSKYDL
jgi:hypothetical protein